MEDNRKLKTHRKNELFVFDQITGELEILEAEFDGAGIESLQSDVAANTGDKEVSAVVLPVANE